jgi:iron complex outermembrane receptor protein
MSALSAIAQHVVSGVVQDSAGTPIPGITYKLKGTKISGVTGSMGKFVLTMPANASGDVIEFSGIGFSDTEVAIGTRTNITVKLLAEVKQLSDVVVTGFGENRQKRNLGYSVTQVSGDDIRRANNINPIAALQGMVAGLQINPGIGGPQGTPRFLIRGSASLDPYGNTPLVVVDDIVMDQEVILPNRGGDQDFGNILKDLNPDDIESVSVLKGGAVTALYGSKASNGVILIRTKKGFSQKGLGVTFNYNGMFDKAYKTVDFQNVYGSGISEDDWTTGPGGELQVDQGTYGFNFGPAMTGQTFRDVSGLLVKNNPNKQNILELYRTGYTGNTNVAVAGGNDKTTFRFSYSNLDSKSITPHNDLDRNSFNLRATHRLAQRVTLDGNVAYTRANTLNPAFQNNNSLIYNYAFNAPRNYDTKYWLTHYLDSAAGGVSTLDPSTANKAFFVLFENKYQQIEDNFRGGLNLKAALTNWLQFEGAASVNEIFINYEEKQRGQGTGFSGGKYRTTARNAIQSRFRGNLNFTQKVKDFDLFLQVGGEVNRSRNKYLETFTNGFVLPDVYRLSNSANPVTTKEFAPNKSQLSSLFFQSSVGFKNYLTLNIYGRNDWNSTLVYNDAHGNYSYFYPGADLAFVFTDALKLPQVFSFGKLRFSYVEAGGGTDVYTANTGSYISQSPYSDAYGNSVIRYKYGSNTLPNQELKPVRNKKMEAGLEFKMFANRFGGDITVYQQDSKNQIIKFGVPSESGVPNALINSGTVRNRGIEVLLYGTPVKSRKFSWDVSFNYTRNSNTIESLPFGLKILELEGGDGIRTVAQVKGDYGTIVSQYAMASYQAVDGSGNHISSPLNGMPVVSFNAASPISGEPMIIYRRASNYNPTVGGDAEPVVGSILPKFMGSLRNTFNYQKVSFSFFLDSKFGGDVYSTTRNYGSQLGAIESTLKGRTKADGGLPFKNNAGNTREDGILPVGVFRPGSAVSAAASADGNAHDVSGMTVADAYGKGYIRPNTPVDYYNYTYGWGNGIRSNSLVKSSWVAVREVSVAYDLPAAWVSRLKVNGLRASLIARNLLYLYNGAADHVNPDNLNTTSSGGFQESGGIPYVRSFGFSLNASF